MTSSSGIITEAKDEAENSSGCKNKRVKMPRKTNVRFYV